MSQVYTPGSARYIVAQALMARGPAIFEAVVAATREIDPRRTMGEVRSALAGLRRAGLAEVRDIDRRWSMTAAGVGYWQAQHRTTAAPTVDQPTAEAGQASRRVMIDCHAAELYTRGLPRWSSPANRMPMVYRPGSLDAAVLPRIAGPWRVWPDGRRERIDGQDDGKAA